MSVKSGVITVSRIETLSRPGHTQKLARFCKELGEPTANLARDRVTEIIMDWHDNGGIIRSARKEVLDLERMDSLGERYVYSCNRSIVKISGHQQLVNLLDSFGQGTRRTINHLYEKIDAPCKRRVQERQLPLMFWLDAALKIQLFR